MKKISTKQIDGLDNELQTVKNLEKEINNLKNIRIGGRNIFYENKCEKDSMFGYIDEYGNVKPSVENIYTDFIENKDYKNLTLKIWQPSTSGNALIGFYDKTKNFINRIKFKEIQYAETVIDIPEGSYYIRISTPRPKRYNGRYKFEYGEKATDYSIALEDENIENDGNIGIQQTIYDLNSFNWNVHPDINVKNFYAIKTGKLVTIKAYIEIIQTQDMGRISLLTIPEELRGKSDDTAEYSQVIWIDGYAPVGVPIMTTLRELKYNVSDGYIDLKADSDYDNFNDCNFSFTISYLSDK